jgi:hypothetical protein
MNLRKNIRANLNVQVVMMGTSHEGLPYKVHGTSTDFSRKGCGVLLDRNYATPGSVVTLLYGNKFQSKAEVRWVRPDPESGGYRVGFRLIHPQLSAGFKIAASLLLCWTFLSQPSLSRASSISEGFPSGRSGTIQAMNSPPPSIPGHTFSGGFTNNTSAALDIRTREGTQETTSWIESLVQQAADSTSNAGYANIDIRMSKDVYRFGDTVAANLYHLSNPSNFEKRVEVKTWLSVPGTAPIPVGNVGADGLFSLAPGSEEEYGPVQLMPVVSDLPAGKYEFNARAIDPVTGSVISEKISPFSIATPSEAPKPSARGIGSSLVVDFQVGKSSYSMGETVASPSGCRITNQDITAATIELKIWLEAPGLQPISVFSVGADGTLVLTPGAAIQLEPLQPFIVTPSLPAGTYQIKTKILDPTTGQQLLETASSFAIQ